jgi:hypothetical protein
MAQNPVRRFLKTLLIAGPEQRVEENVIRLERGISFELAAPVAFRVHLREKKLPRGRDRRPYAGAQFLNFPEAKLWV